MEVDNEVAAPADTSLADVPDGTIEDNEPVVVHRYVEPDTDDVATGTEDDESEEVEEEEAPVSEDEESEEKEETADTETPEKSATDAEKQAAKKAKILADTGGDPDKLAERYLALQELQSRQAAELGTLRNGGQANGDSSRTSSEPVITLEEASKPVFKTVTEDWTKYPVNPETGLIAWKNERGEPQDFLPLDNYGIPFYPPSYWEKREEILLEQYPDRPATVARLIVQEQAQANNAYQADLKAKADTVAKMQQVVVSHQEQSMAKVFGRQYPEPIARGLAAKVTTIAKLGLNDQITKGLLHPSHANNPQSIQAATSQVLASMYVDGSLEKRGKSIG